jgi:hypothetical protein
LLLLLPFAMLPIFLVVVAIQPVELGSYVVISGFGGSSQASWSVYTFQAAVPQDTQASRGRRYRATSDYQILSVELGYWECAIEFFRGHRLP